MSYTLRLDHLTHDLRIKDGHFERIDSADEVRQRVKVTLMHYLGEYFLNRPGGMPYYKTDRSPIHILGNKLDESIVHNIMRQKIQEVPGVVSVDSAHIDYRGRVLKYECRITVRTVDGTEQLEVNNIRIGD